MMILDALTPAALVVLEHLPCAPNGLSVRELADGLLDSRGPAARGEIGSALQEIADTFAGLAVRRGDDFLGRADVELWGLPRDTHRVVRRLFAGQTVGR